MARILKHYPSVAPKVEDLDSEIDFLRIFGRCGPAHIEIGTGKATFLLNQTGAQPEVNFLGIEWARRYYRYAVDRIGRWGVKNVRIIRTDAAKFLADFVRESCVDCFHIYFPDPWPKKRHHKRRKLGMFLCICRPCLARCERTEMRALFSEVSNDAVFAKYNQVRLPGQLVLLYSVINIHNFNKVGCIFLQHTAIFKYLITFNQLKHDSTTNISF